MATMESAKIQGANSALATGSKGRLKRRNP